MSNRDELFQLMLGRTTTKAVERILAAGYRRPFIVRPGLYRNALGAEIEVTTFEAARHIIGGVWNAYVKDDLFPRHLIVTPEGLRDAGYEMVDAATSEPTQ